jgi:hypothetical protein
VLCDKEAPPPANDGTHGSSSAAAKEGVQTRAETPPQGGSPKRCHIDRDPGSILLRSKHGSDANTDGTENAEQLEENAFQALMKRNAKRAQGAAERKKKVVATTRTPKMRTTELVLLRSLQCRRSPQLPLSLNQLAQRSQLALKLSVRRNQTWLCHHCQPQCALR